MKEIEEINNELLERAIQESLKETRKMHGIKEGENRKIAYERMNPVDEMKQIDFIFSEIKNPNNIMEFTDEYASYILDRSVDFVGYGARVNYILGAIGQKIGSKQDYTEMLQNIKTDPRAQEVLVQATRYADSRFLREHYDELLIIFGGKKFLAMDEEEAEEVYQGYIDGILESLSARKTAIQKEQGMDVGSEMNQTHRLLTELDYHSSFPESKVMNQALKALRGKERLHIDIKNKDAHKHNYDREAWSNENGNVEDKLNILLGLAGEQLSDEEYASFILAVSFNQTLKGEVEDCIKYVSFDDLFINRFALQDYLTYSVTGKSKNYAGSKEIVTGLYKEKKRTEEEIKKAEEEINKAEEDIKKAVNEQLLNDLEENPYDDNLVDDEIEEIQKTFKERLYDRKNAKDFTGTVNLINQFFQKEDYDDPYRQQNIDDISTFWEEVSADTENPDSVKFIADAADYIFKSYYDKIYRLGVKRDELKKDIADGKIKELRLVADDPGFVNKIAHDIVLLHEKDDNVFQNVINSFSQHVSSVNGVPIGEFVEKRENEIKNQKIAEHNITADTMSRYLQEFKDQNTSNTGFKIKRFKPVDGESLFEEIPEHITTIQELKTAGELDTLEESLFETADAYNRYVQMAASAVKYLKKLYADIKKLSDEEAEKTQEHRDLLKYLEAATHLGTDYKLNDPSVIDVKPSAELSFANIKNAITWLRGSMEHFADQLEARIDAHEHSANKNVEQYKHDVALQNTVTDLCNLVDYMKEKNDAFGLRNLSGSDIRKIESERHCIDNQRALNGLIKSVGQKEEGYGSTLTEQSQALSDALMNNLVLPEPYERLFKLIEENKRLYRKIRAAGTSNDALNESKQTAYDRYNDLYGINKTALVQQINACKQFERTFNSDTQLSGQYISRVKILDRISKTLSMDPVKDDKRERNKTWNRQKNDFDKLWFGIQFSYRCELLSMGGIYSEADREKYGFNQTGEVSSEEKALNETYKNDILDGCAHFRSFQDLIGLGVNLGRLRVKSTVASGKEYNTIKSSLGNVENNELKAKYLYNSSKEDLRFAAIASYEDKYKAILKDAIINDQAINSRLGLDNINLTYGQLANNAGLSEAEAAAFFEKKNLDRIQKVWVNRTEQNKNALMADTAQLAAEMIAEVVKKRGTDREKAILSVRDKKYYDYSVANYDAAFSKNDEAYAPITNWINEEGSKLSEDLLKAKTFYNLNKTNASVRCGRPMGLDPETELGRYYHNSLKFKDAYMNELIAEKKPVGDVIDKVITEDKNVKLANKSIKSLPVSFDVYIEKHTAARGGKTTEEMITNLAKTMAAANLKKMGDNPKFSLKTIHKGADLIRETYMLDTLADNPEELREALRGESSAIRFENILRNRIYGVDQNSYNEFFDELEVLSQNMISKEGRSTKYGEMYDAIKEAADLKEGNRTPEEMRNAVSTANFKIYEAVRKYISGKEKVRSSYDGKDNFDSALDAIAILAKFAPGTAGRKNKMIDNINRIRNGNNPEAANYISADNFVQEYGAVHSGQVAHRRAVRKGLVQEGNKVQKGLNKA